MNEICGKLAAGDIIVLIAVAVAVILAVVFSFRRKRKGGCCSGGCCNCKNCDLDKDRDKKTDNKG